MTRPFLDSSAALPYCRGCGHGVVLRALDRALEILALPPAETAIVTDIGCVGLADGLFVTPHTVHTTHGRSPAFAAGIALADSVLGSDRVKPVVLIGDGGATIGIAHLVNAALLNPDVTVLVHNNFLFGMTGGQNSAFSPLGFVTATTPAGNFIPPLDLARVLIASRAAFVARKIASDRDLPDTIARAVAHPGFAVVEVLELCTAHATRRNPLTGAQLAVEAEWAGYELGILREERRPTFGQAYKEAARSLPGVAHRGIEPRFTSELQGRAGVVLAGTAGERVQTAASILAGAGALSRLRVTQKNDNPVTQGTGFSVSEVILSRGEILYTGVESPDALLVVSADGVAELARGGVFAKVSARTRVLCDATLELPDLPCPVRRIPFRRLAGPKLAAVAAVARWIRESGSFPLDAFWAALDSRFGGEAAAARSAIASLLESPGAGGIDS
jgi:pyruvate/2-oxoacid:ferredoxin oxidoreductase beta subunit